MEYLTGNKGNQHKMTKSIIGKLKFINKNLCFSFVKNIDLWSSAFIWLCVRLLDEFNRFIQLFVTVDIDFFVAFKAEYLPGRCLDEQTM